MLWYIYMYHIRHIYIYIHIWKYHILMSVGEPSLAPPPPPPSPGSKGRPSAAARSSPWYGRRCRGRRRWHPGSSSSCRHWRPGGMWGDFMAQNSISERFHGDFTICINIYNYQNRHTDTRMKSNPWSSGMGGWPKGFFFWMIPSIPPFGWQEKLMVKTKGHSFCHILVVVLPNLNDSCWWYAPFLLLTIVFVCCIPFIQWFPTPKTVPPCRQISGCALYPR